MVHWYITLQVFSCRPWSFILCPRYGVQGNVYHAAWLTVHNHRIATPQRKHHGTSWNHSFNHFLKILKGLKGSWESRMASHMVASMVQLRLRQVWNYSGRQLADAGAWGSQPWSRNQHESTLQILTGSGTWNRSEIWKRLEIHHDHTWSTWEMQTETGRAVFGALQAQSDLCFLLIPDGWACAQVQYSNMWTTGLRSST